MTTGSPRLPGGHFPASPLSPGPGLTTVLVPPSWPRQELKQPHASLCAAGMLHMESIQEEPRPTSLPTAIRAAAGAPRLPYQSRCRSSRPHAPGSHRVTYIIITGTFSDPRPQECRGAQGGGALGFGSTRESIYHSGGGRPSSGLSQFSLGQVAGTPGDGAVL